MCSQLNKPSESVQMSMLGFLSARSFSTSTSQFSSGSLPCTKSTSSTTSSNLSDAANESSHDDATNESSHDDLPPTNKEIGTNPQINPSNLDALMTNTGLAFTKTSISSSTPKSKHESDVDDASHGQVFVNAPLSINLNPGRDAERRLFLIVFWTGLVMEEKRGNWKKQEWFLIKVK